MNIATIHLIKTDNSKQLYFSDKAMQILKLNPNYCKIGIALQATNDGYSIFIFVTSEDKFNFTGSNNKSVKLSTAKINLSTHKATSKHLYDLIYSHSKESMKFYITDTYVSVGKETLYKLETEQEYTKLEEITTNEKTIEIELWQNNKVQSALTEE